MDSRNLVCCNMQLGKTVRKHIGTLIASSLPFVCTSLDCDSSSDSSDSDSYCDSSNSSNNLTYS